MAQRGQDRRAEETEEQRNRRLAIMAKRGQERRAEGTDEQRNSRLCRHSCHRVPEERSATHLLLILADEDKIKDPESIDWLGSEELPDETLDSRLHGIVKATMIHGPCGLLNPYSPCMADGICTKVYPKQFREAAAENVDGYPMYRRRDNANHASISGTVVDNRWILPYNPYLTKKYNCWNMMVSGDTV
ncbi:hypothetical protein AVEN_228207-1 [Araneus ventricosus]|uniref:STPR domain-containing protein n=1 Tax=Araneus ventricosus TaxID=182803 RepID=A0A4Y2N8S2_ARAVE|nr:hypothetical protein AVEN_228207-1 [Araneus ventricosus]